MPIDGREIVTSRGTWMVRLQDIRVEANSTMRIAEIQLTGPERFEATIRIPTEKLVVENREGEIDWLLTDLRRLAGKSQSGQDSYDPLEPIQVNQLLTYLSRASVTGSRSTALQPLHWLLGLMLTATLGAVQVDAPMRLVVFLSACSGVAFLLECGAYVYFLRKDPDALRSEHFTLEKMRLERVLWRYAVWLQAT